MIESYINVLKLIFGNKRLLLVIGVSSGIFAILSFFSESFLRYFYQFLKLDLAETSIPITFLLISLASLAIIYLQSGNNGSEDQAFSKRLFERFMREIELSKRKMTLLSEEVSSLKEILSKQGDNTLTSDDREKLIERIVKEQGKEYNGPQILNQ